MEPEPYATLVVETENLRNGDSERLEGMLHGLASQLRQLGRQVEVLVYHDDEVDEAEVARSIDLSGIRAISGTDVEVIAADGRRYYEVKNHGASRSRAQIVAFIDADLELEEGYLGALLGPFDDPTIEVVVGSSYVAPEGAWYQRAFSAFWVFPLRTDDGPLIDATALFANSVAFRTRVARRNPFPQDDRYRGACSTLVRQLRDRGVKVVQNPLARSRHPPPRGFTVRRALWRGRDRERSAQLGEWRMRPGPISVFAVLLRDVSVSCGRIVRYRRLVGLRRRELPAALLLAVGFQGLVWVGFVVAAIKPGFIERRYPL